jgi:pSer/pThr/pTyr-binding forkhead associated (FHA) protein
VTTIGADPGACQIAIDDEFASSIHAEVVATGQGYAVHDLGSANGTFINEIKISREPLADGDVLRVGHTPMSFREFRR